MSGPAWHRDEHYPHSLHKPGFHKRYELALDVVLSLAEAGIPGSAFKNTVEYRANWDETFAFTCSSSKLLRSSTSIQKLVLNAGANLHLPATSSRVFSSSSETLVFSGSSGMLKMMLCCFDKHTKRSSARKLDTPQKKITSKPPNVIHNLFETEKPLIP